ncbi:MAG: lytic transglycosylase domain-containing protein [Pseudomonadota bacterium]|nr:lytic transglycosylase domain-containing protein [Pseudomonadota bacterium]
MKPTPTSEPYRRAQPLRWAPLTRALLVMALLTGAHAARADIYGYVDVQSDTHFATEKLDDRYQLFIKGDRAFDASQPGPGTAVAEHSALFKAITNHPNLKKYEALLTEVGHEYHVDVALMKAMMAAESGFNPHAVSPKGAVGLMQIMPATAQRYGIEGDARRSIEQKLTDPAINVRLAARYLHDLEQLFPQQQALVIASYNAGEKAVQRYRNTVPPFAETRSYVQLVTQFYQFYQPRAARATLGNAVISSADNDADTEARASRDGSRRRVHLTIPGRANMPAPASALD